MSSNGRARRCPRAITRTRPTFSATYTLFGSFFGAVTTTGSVRSLGHAHDAQLGARRLAVRAQRDERGDGGERNGYEGDAAHSVRHFFSRTRRSSSSLPGSRIAST